MRKMSDRFLLGVVSGLVGNTAKDALGQVLTRSGLAKFDLPQRAAGMLVPEDKIRTPNGRVVGWLADYTVASVVGVGLSYGLAASGTKKAIYKGALAGAATWAVLYGVMGTLGASKDENHHPKTVIAEFVAHALFGAVTAGTIASLGEKNLFRGGVHIPARTPRRFPQESESEGLRPRTLYR